MSGDQLHPAAYEARCLNAVKEALDGVRKTLDVVGRTVEAVTLEGHYPTATIAVIVRDERKGMRTQTWEIWDPLFEYENGHWGDPDWVATLIMSDVLDS